jgi:hypothetical protein
LQGEFFFFPVIRWENGFLIRKACLSEVQSGWTTAGGFPDFLSKKHFSPFFF